MKKLVITPSLIADSLSPQESDFYIEVLMKIVQDGPIKLCVDSDASILSDYKSIPDRNSMLRTWINLLTNTRLWNKNVEISGNKIINSSLEQRKSIDIADGIFDECKIVALRKQEFINEKDELEKKNHILIDKNDCINLLGAPVKEEFIYRLVDALSRMQERDDTVDLEDIHNDRLTDYLRNEGYQVADQSRSGKAKKTAGELDLCIRKKSGTIDCIIEALREKSAGTDNENIINHINKLIYNYDCSGNKVNYIICYCEAKGYTRFVNNYINYIDNLKNHPLYNSKYELLETENVTSVYSEKNYITVLKSKFDRSPLKLVLYHLIVHFANQD